MRKIIVLEFLSLDGVMQAPGGSKEDAAEGFKFGGWTAPFNDDQSGEEMEKQMKRADLLLGRKTFDIFEGYWPTHTQFWPQVNEVTKYVLSKTRKKSDWENSVFLKNVDEIKKLKKTKGLDLQIYGSSELVHLLLKNDLVDEIWLKTYPVILGKGKRLFDETSLPKTFKLTKSLITSKGVIFAYYEKGGKIVTGEVG